MQKITKNIVHFGGFTIIQTQNINKHETTRSKYLCIPA